MQTQIDDAVKLDPAYPAVQRDIDAAERPNTSRQRTPWPRLRGIRILRRADRTCIGRILTPRFAPRMSFMLQQTRIAIACLMTRALLRVGRAAGTGRGHAFGKAGQRSTRFTSLAPPGNRGKAVGG